MHDKSTSGKVAKHKRRWQQEEQPVGEANRTYLTKVGLHVEGND